jgi:dipeptidyl aminopeptidase/acylaminoacyl peptidase
MWDVRRLLSWVRAQGAPAVGVHGLSLGGYNAALLASLDDGLACAIAGIPVTDFTRLYDRHLPVLHHRTADLYGLPDSVIRELLRVVSPLALEPRIPRERRFLFGGVADRLVPPDQVRDLWRHWEMPRIAWYPGSHLTFRLHRNVAKLVLSALVESGLSP